ncbi:M1 family metallopeptidase [Streptomyces cynarae]|uniref:M1 family metallopeptidase n=1 Tax=Streptomyces cynarae TaxID=2981134 RepID=UPI00406C5E16
MALLLLVSVACSSPERTTAGQPGAPGAKDALFPSAGNGGYDVSHYGLALTYVPETNHLKGSAVISARATQDLSRFNLDLTGLRVRHAVVNGVAAQFSRSAGELTLTPSHVIEKGKTFTATIQYDGNPRTLRDSEGGVEGWLETDDGAVALGEPNGSAAWFPGNHHPSDKAAYDITVTVPDDSDGDAYVAVSNGELVSKEVAEDRVTVHWRSKEPMASYLATIAIGSFDIGEGRTADGVPVYVAVDPDEAQDSKKLRNSVSDIVTWASDRFGPYPFRSTGAVVDHLPDLGYALETQTRPYFGSVPDERLLVHELAHQWFGNSVTPRAWKDMWLNEGFATYAEWLWQEDTGGDTAQQIFDAFYEGTHSESDGIWDFPPADPPSGVRVSDPPVYGRGAMTLHKVREAVGDSVFFTILRTWTAEHRHGNADTAQFTALCERLSGKDLSGLFRTWLYRNGRPAAA